MSEYNYRYQIVPKPGGNMVCSNCGAEFDGLPEYSQVTYLLRAAGREPKADIGIAIGFGVPMCSDCESAMQEKQRRVHRSFRAMYIIVGTLALAIFAALYQGGDFGMTFGVGVLLAVVIFAMNYFGGKAEPERANACVDEKVFDMIASPYGKLVAEGWIKLYEEGAFRARTCSVAELRKSLEGILADGKYMLLDQHTGTFVDLSEPGRADEVYRESLRMWEDSD